VNRKFLLAGGLAGALAAGSGASVVIADFCADDPIIQIAPGKVAYLTDQADSPHLASLQAVKYRVLHTSTDQDGRTHVTLLVYVPSDPSGDSFDVKYTVSSGPDGSGEVLADGETESGKVVIIHFILPN
jgi:hypothetical protein